jgi:hypothetical protein
MVMACQVVPEMKADLATEQMALCMDRADAGLLISGGYRRE